MATRKKREPEKPKKVKFRVRKVLKEDPFAAKPEKEEPPESKTNKED